MIGSLFDAAATAAGAVSASAGACVRRNPVLAVRHDCRECEAVCPTGAVELDPLRVLAPPCDGCGLCLPSCPAVAFAERSSARSQWLEAWRATEYDVPFLLTCGLAEPPAHGPFLDLACMAALRWETILVPVLLDAPRVELRRGRCQECRYGKYVTDRLERAIAFAAELARALGLGAIDSAVSPAGPSGARSAPRDADPASRRRLSRREIFTRVFQRGRDTAAALGRASLAEFARRLQEKPPGEARVDRLWLRDLVVELMPVGPAATAAVPVGPLTGRPEIDAERCTRCGVCAAACPTGALLLDRGTGDSNGLLLKSAWCTGCGYCQKACREDAVSFSDTLKLCEWKSAPIELAAPIAPACRICGARALDGVLSLCPKCYRTRHSFEAAVRNAAPETATKQRD